MKRYLILVSCILFTILRAQEIPPEITDPEEREILGIAVKLTRPSPAFRAKASEMLLKEADFFAHRLNLPLQFPIQPSEASIRVSPPWYSKRDNTNVNLSMADRICTGTFFASGVVESSKFTFSFGGPENRRFVHRFRIKDEDSIFELYPELAATPSLIDTNGAYQLATQWLASISIDLPALEKANPVSFYQWFFWGKPEDLPKDHWTISKTNYTEKTMLPIYDVNWNEAIKVTILGSTKELMELRIQDASYLKRPPLIIQNAIELNARTNPEPRLLQRRNSSSGNSNLPTHSIQ